ncbi:hypothetical protein MFRU_009g01080 [Monilinia fructicola]|nr:hypothetical protein MFRU_009g01080 [Monilinia fructicola]
MSNHLHATLLAPLGHPDPPSPSPAPKKSASLPNPANSGHGAVSYPPSPPVERYISTEYNLASRAAAGSQDRATGNSASRFRALHPS